MQSKKEWLQNLTELLKMYLNDYHQMTRLHFDRFDGKQEIFDFYYDMSIHASNINVEIHQGTFNKALSFDPDQYCRKAFGYDSVAMCEKFDTLHAYVEMYSLLAERHIYKFHLQEAFQRVQMDLHTQNGFAVFIMDELNTETMKQIKSVCHEFTANGAFIRNYGNVYHSILTEYSNQSAGIQLADYVAGAMYGYLRRSFCQWVCFLPAEQCWGCNSHPRWCK